MEDNQLSAIVLTKQNELEKYFLFFKLILNDKITSCSLNKEYAKIDTDEINIRFYNNKKDSNTRGLRSNFVIDLTKEYNEEEALHMYAIADFRTENQRKVWREVAEGNRDG